MADQPSQTDHLWKEYGLALRDWDDLTLARWLAQTLGQLEGKAWRVSHPLVETYRLGAQLAHERQVWFKRLATPPVAYAASHCCRAPMLPLLTRDVKETGLICLHCNETLVPFDETPEEIRTVLGAWADEYSPLHAVAHWDEGRQKSVPSYDRAYENAARQVEQLLGRAGFKLARQMLEFYPAVVWEDHDECLEVQPEDITEAKVN